MNSIRQPPNVKVTAVTQKSLEYEGQLMMLYTLIYFDLLDLLLSTV